MVEGPLEYADQKGAFQFTDYLNALAAGEIGPPLTAELLDSWQHSVSGDTASPIDFGPFTETFSNLLVLCIGVTKSVSGTIRAAVGTGDGPTFLTSSGDYQLIDPNGTLSATADVSLHDTGATAARSCFALFFGAGGALFKIARTSSLNDYYVNDENAVSGIRMIASAGGNFTGGAIYVIRV